MKMLIGGERVASLDSAELAVFDPANGKLIDSVPMATPDDVDRAVVSALEGYASWSKTPLHERIRLMKRFHHLYLQHADELRDLLVKEVGKPLKKATAEVTFAGEFIEHYAEQARFVGGETYPLSNRIKNEGDLLLTIREPLGVLVGLMPFNYPISQLPHKIVAPLLMGNSVILKPASETPLSGIRFVELMWEAGFPGNAIQVLTGSGARIGRQLCLDPRVSAVSLTGSTEVGIEIAKTAATHLHHVKLELGGNDPLIILEDADLDLAVDESIAGRSVQNAGQACCASKRFIVSNKIKDAYVEKLIAKLSALKTGDPADPETDFGPVISAKAAKVALQQVQDAISSGARLLLGGSCANGTFFELTVLDVTREMAIARDEEVFAPVWPIIGFDTVEEAVSIANDTKYGLSSGVIGKDMKQLLQVAKTIQAGACIINGSGDYRSYDQPFGGYKMTGLGREGSRHTLESVLSSRPLSSRAVSEPGRSPPPAASASDGPIGKHNQQRGPPMKSLSIFRPSRRSFLLGTGAAALCTPAIFTSARAADRVILTRDAGGPVAKAYTAAYYDPFEKETGIKVIGIPSGAAPLALVKSIVETKSYTWDLVGGLTLASITQLRDQGDYLEKIGLDDSEAVKQIPAGMRNDYGVGIETFATVLGYRTDTVKNVPQSYADFWNVKDFPGRRAMRKSPLDSIEQALLADGVAPDQLYPCDLDRAFKKLDEIKPHISSWWSEGAQATQLLISGEVDICPTWSSRVQTAKDQGAPVEIMWNQNTWGVGCWSIIKGTPKADLCREFIAFASQAKCQAIMGNENVNGPVNPEAYKLIDSARAEMLPSAPDHISRSIQVNEAFWAENADKAIERFTTWLIA